MFQFPGLAAHSLLIQLYTSEDSLRRLPDSDIPGSTLVSSSPRLFAAFHVLHRLSMPRHPPCALRSLTVSLRHVSVARVQGSIRDRSPYPQPLRYKSHSCFLMLSTTCLFSFQIRESSSVLAHSPSPWFPNSRFPSNSRTKHSALQCGVFGVELNGLEPMTPGLQSQCSPN